MKPTPGYTEFHPRWYRRKVSTYWWIGHLRYLKFLLRELSSVFVAYFVGLTLWQVHALAEGPQAYEQFQERLRSPLMLVLSGISLFFLVFHAITWFNLAPRAMVVRVLGRRVPDVVIAGSNYAAWLVVSALVGWIILGR